MGTRVLLPLASEEEKQKMQINDLAFDFANRIMRLYTFLTQESQNKEFITSKQIYRSGTSIGANLNEAQHPQSDADFLSKASIALKEARETEYWLRLLYHNGYIDKTLYDSLNHDIDRILRILITITTKVKKRLGAKR